uniref:Uncharacterized protein n=1 Tax=Haptolina ericina TaxID=156174 RepID=A0A7S3AI73_9EUKA|mmetsp:Transcript_17558/g.39359  ORF Transcript_17558/g.39359 Transcript_17558/m.39359 type:complete len:148 (+) Transcript_17558:367-810(+)
MGTASVFARVSPSFEADDYVKGQFTFTQWYTGYGFYGTLATLTTNTMYKVKKAAGATLTFAGDTVELPKPFSFVPGWNYIPCVYQAPATLERAFETLTTLDTTDTLKSQMQFTTYYSGFGWFGQLSTLVPGEGYKLKLAAGGQGTFA